MSSPIHAQVSSSFVSNGNAINIALPAGYDDIELFNISTETLTSTDVMYAKGNANAPAGYALYDIGSSTSGTLTPKFTLTNGFTFISDSSQFPSGAQTVASAISSANPGVVSTSSTLGLATGSIVRITNSTGLLQIGGLDFTVGSVIANTSFALTYLDTSSTNVNGSASAAKWQLLATGPRYYPPRRYIVNMASSGVNTLITMSVTHQYTVGQEVRIYCPSNFGMTQINGLLGVITAIGTADVSGITNTITVNINSSSFTAFSWPTSATAASGTNFAFVEPVGEAAQVPYQNLLDDATYNQSFSGVQIGSAVQTSGKTYQWVATKGVSY
jgi:hypothetical protein|uniref:Uncharacterized protein n=1 Tax=uncultured Caudovirales phage TaxID=2100421 RepID=A0A6J5KVB5_9CAUD|nr:hypothetical protein UFOVP88_20 [uncultured Caudovirales phage]